MRRNLFALVSLPAFVLVFSLATASAQDFQKSYSLAAGGTVSVRNVSGDVVVTGYDGDQILVSGYKEGDDRDLVSVEDLSSGNSVDVRAKYPRNCNCDASIRFELRVPRSVRYTFDPITSASGDIKLTGVTGTVRVNTASGNVEVSHVTGDIQASTASGLMRVREVAGTVSASTASGNVEVEIARLEGDGGMKFSSASGNVDVRVPSSIDADVQMATASGSIKTNFPLEVRDHDHEPGSRAEGRLGSGARRLRITTASGNVSLISK